MINILFTDTHFGVKQNSITWLNSQCDFIYNQFIPYIKRLGANNKIRLIHLGDVFDSRSSISVLVATKIVEMFKELSDIVDEFIIIGGNHDYYSPNIDSIDTLNLLLQDTNIKLITKDIYIENEDLFVPWYKWKDQEYLQNIINEHHIKNVFTHADIVTEKVNIKNVNIYSGHIHMPYIKKHIRNLGSCYALNFADANSPRGFYVLNDKLTFVENETSIKFHRLYNEDIFKDLKINQNDYVEIYINQLNLSNIKYTTQLSLLAKAYKNLWIIPQINSTISLQDFKFDNYDMDSIIKDMIPDELKSKFALILNQLNG